MSAVGRLASAVAGAVLARGALRVASAAPAGVHGALARRNFRGREVSLTGGAALALAASVSAAAGALVRGRGRLAAASLLAGLGAGLVGGYDDVIGARPGQPVAKGLAGHLGALRAGRVSTGVVKLAGLAAAGLLAATTLPARHPRPGRGPSDRAAAGRAAQVVLDAAVIAGTANLLNLLDLRPGRALKGGLMLGAPLVFGHRAEGSAAGPLGAAVALLPDDLGERVMLGDCGASALGAVIGVALASRCGPFRRVAAVAGLIGLTAASERVSFTTVIDRTPVLRAVDRLGRRAD